MLNLSSSLTLSFTVEFSRFFKGLAVLSLVLFLSGCATYSAGFYGVESAAANRNLDGAVKSLDELKLTGADLTLHHLNKATLLRLQGQFSESNRQFDAAKTLMEQLAAISVTEQLASVTVNDGMRAYEGLPSEQLMVYSFLSLNYLQMGDVDAAAVEARQFNVKQGLIAQKNAKAPYLSGAFSRYLNSMVFEASGGDELDSARIELEKAREGYRAQNADFPVPSAIAADLQRLRANRAMPSEVTFVLHNGLGPSLDEETIRVVNPTPGERGPVMFSLAVPKFVKRVAPVARVVLSAGGNSVEAEMVEDINALAEKSFKDRLPLIIARAVSRLVVKNVASQAAKKQAGDNPLFNLVADIATNASERADTRTWSLIPANILMARLPLSVGQYDVTATYYDANNQVIGTRVFTGVAVQKAHKTFIADYFLNPPAAPKAPR
jgi:hypothetical protein